MDKKILCIDMDSYFASVEQITDPRLRNKPIIVCGEIATNRYARTIVTTASYEARKYGIKTGMTIPEAQKLCSEVKIVVGDHSKYIDTTLKIHKILIEYTDLVEMYSIDESFLDVTDSQTLFGNALILSTKIKQRIKQEIGLNSSIGIGPNKTIAKLGSKMSKPNGLLEIQKDQIPELFANLKVEDMQGIGIGKKLAEKLKSIGIFTAEQLGNAHLSLLMSYFGILGYHLKNIGSGKGDEEVKSYLYKQPIKSVGHSHTLSADTNDINVIKSYLRLLSEKVGVRLRGAGMMGKEISLVIRYADFKTITKNHRINQPIKTGYEIYNNVLPIFGNLLPLTKPVRLVGVSIGGLIINTNQQVLFTDISNHYKITDVIDEINKKYGEWTIKPAEILTAEKFGIKERCGLIGKYLFAK